MKAFAQDNIESDLADMELCEKVMTSNELPKKIDDFKELIATKCESETYLGRPTFTYTYKVINKNFEKELKTRLTDYRNSFFHQRCRNQDGTYNRSNYRAIYLDQNNKKIGDLFISFYECIGAYDDKITNGRGVDFTLKFLNKVIKDFENYREQTKLMQEDYLKLLNNAKLLLSKYQSLQSSMESERTIRAIEALGRIGGPIASSDASGNRSFRNNMTCN